MSERRQLPSWVLAGLGAAPLLPSCVDLSYALFRCDVCGGWGGPGAARRRSLWKRRNAIRALEREGSRKIRLIP